MEKSAAIPASSSCCSPPWRWHARHLECLKQGFLMLRKWCWSSFLLLFFFLHVVHTFILISRVSESVTTLRDSVSGWVRISCLLSVFLRYRGRGSNLVRQGRVASVTWIVFTLLLDLHQLQEEYSYPHEVALLVHCPIRARGTSIWRHAFAPFATLDVSVMPNKLGPTQLPDQAP